MHKILVTPKERASKRGEEVPFTHILNRKVALMIKTATGIKTFIEEESYGA